MADYHAKTRSNWFSVKDLGAFQDWLNSLESELMIDIDGSDNTVCFFGECSIPTFDNDGEEVDFKGVLATHLSDGECAVIFEIGNEKLRYLTGYAVAIAYTGETVELGLHDIYKKAQEAFLGCDIREHWV